MAAGLFDWLKALFGGGQPSGAPFARGKGPARLLIMRHAEKTGDKRDPDLSQAGEERAQQLATWLPRTFGKPDFIIAAARSKRSNRSYETVAPLAQALGLPIRDDLDYEDTETLVEELAEPQYAGKYGVIAWHHSEIPAMLAELGAQQGSYPDTWDETVFDLVFDLHFRDNAPPAIRAVNENF